VHRLLVHPLQHPLQVPLARQLMVRPPPVSQRPEHRLRVHRQRVSQQMVRPLLVQVRQQMPLHLPQQALKAQMAPLEASLVLCSKGLAVPLVACLFLLLRHLWQVLQLVRQP